MSASEPQKPKNGAPSPYLLLFALTAVFAVIVVAALAFINRPSAPQPGEGETDTGAAIIDSDAFSTGVNDVEPKPVTDFTLTRTDNSALRISDLRGRYTLLYFGYTHCPDFCPSTMTDWRLIRRGLADDADRMNFMMVSVDPERDTPEMLTRYLDTFDPAIIGATGDAATLRAMAEEFGAYYEAVGHDDTPLYVVNHTASQFLIDPDGRFVAVYTFGTPVDVITEDLRARLAQ